MCVTTGSCAVSQVCEKGQIMQRELLQRYVCPPPRCTAIALKLNIYNTNPTVIVKN